MDGMDGTEGRMMMGRRSIFQHDGMVKGFCHDTIAVNAFSGQQGENDEMLAYLRTVEIVMIFQLLQS